jgi:NADH-quinone oxidoreductase subunit G/NADP-reducing hydrogenase subunit HndD
MEVRKSHENPQIIKAYSDFLGSPLSEKAHELLHTHT